MYDFDFLNKRELHSKERIIFQGRVQVAHETRVKQRYAVLCPTRLLLFKEASLTTKALSVYPLINSEFEMSGDCLQFSFTTEAIVNNFHDLGELLWITKKLYFESNGWLVQL